MWHGTLQGVLLGTKLDEPKARRVWMMVYPKAGGPSCQTRIGDDHGKFQSNNGKAEYLVLPDSIMRFNALGRTIMAKFSKQTKKAVINGFKNEVASLVRQTGVYPEDLWRKYMSAFWVFVSLTAGVPVPKPTTKSTLGRKTVAELMAESGHAGGGWDDGMEGVVAGPVGRALTAPAGLAAVGRRPVPAPAYPGGYGSIRLFGGAGSDYSHDAADDSDQGDLASDNGGLAGMGGAVSVCSVDGWLTRD